MPNFPFLKRALCIGLTLGITTVNHAQNPPATFVVDAGVARHPISPNIYGVAYASTSQLAALNCPLNRSGGNATSRYNWRANASNRAMDYFFESIGESSATPGEQGDTFMASSRAAGSQAMLTVPMIGWVAKLGPQRGKLASFSVRKYGLQQATDPYLPDAGNGVRSDGRPVTGNDPNDANMPSSPSFQAGWFNHLVTHWGPASRGGLRYYLTDNEPSIWFSTHRDVHSVGATMEEVRNDIVAYGGGVKAADPTALVVGPEEWGWSGYQFSGYDQQWGAQHGWANLPDRSRHSGADYLPWLLDQLRRNQAATGKRILDIFSVHYYPQGGEFGDDVSPAMQLRRNRSTRSLWDPNYVDESWINDKVRLIPRLHGWVNQYYPGTGVALTEYNWGAESHINGATAEADVLGILGREGADLANRWTVPGSASPTFKAMQLYRNYDGHKSSFGDVSVLCRSAYNSNDVAAFASGRTLDGVLTIMVVAKMLSGTTPIAINLANFRNAGVSQVWQLTAANRINRLADLPVINSRLTTIVPAQSICLFVLAPTR